MPRLLVSLSFCLLMITQPSHGQSNDQKAIEYAQGQIFSVKKILRTQSDLVSNSCLEALKKIFLFKKQLLRDNKSLSNQDVNLSILRSLTDNGLQVCTVDAQSICNHHRTVQINKICQQISNQ